MIIIITREDLRPEFHHLKPEEVSTRHTHLAGSPTPEAMEFAAGYSEGVVFLDSDQRVFVIKCREHNGKWFDCLLDYIKLLTDLHICKSPGVSPDLDGPTPKFRGLLDRKRKRRRHGNDRFRL